MRRIKRDFGRPKDQGLEKQFMERLRGNKLQAIIACCEYQLALHEMSQDHKDLSTSLPQNLISKHELFALQIPNLSSDEKQKLDYFIGKAKEEWEFIELNNEDPLPQFLFDHQKDLSFILQKLKEKFGYTIFKSSELLFISLLLNQESKVITRKVFDYIRTKITLIIQGLDEGIKKIKEELNLKRNQEDLDVDAQANQAQESRFKQSSTPKKKKKITKEESRRKSKKSKKIEGKKNQSGISINKEILYPQGMKLALTTCNHIIWAYWYILSK